MAVPSLTPREPQEQKLQTPDPGAAGMPSGSNVASSMLARRGGEPRAGIARVGGRRSAGIPRAPGVPRGRRAFGPREPRRGGGERNNNYGLNVRSKEPYNPLSSPFRTRGQFNQGVLNLARNEYKPAQDQLKGEEQGEKLAFGERKADLSKIYGQYGAEAQKAFNDARTALGEIIAKQSQAGTAAQATLQAALAPGTNTQPYMGSAGMDQAIIGGGTSGILGSIVGEAAREQAIPGVAGTEARKNELARHLQAQEGFNAERQKIAGMIPAAIEKARQELTSEEQNREGLGFQQRLAQKQFGMSAQGQKFEEGLKNRQQKLAEQSHRDEMRLDQQKFNREFSIQERRDAEQSGINLAQLALQRQQLQEQGNVRSAERQKNAITYMVEFFKPQKGEMLPGAKREKPSEVPYRRDPNALFKALTGIYGMSNGEALQMMKSSGHPEAEKYVHEYENQEANRRKGGESLKNFLSRAPKLKPMPGAGSRSRGR